MKHDKRPMGLNCHLSITRYIHSECCMLMVRRECIFQTHRTEFRFVISHYTSFGTCNKQPVPRMMSFYYYTLLPRSKWKGRAVDGDRNGDPYIPSQPCL